MLKIIEANSITRSTAAVEITTRDGYIRISPALGGLRVDLYAKGATGSTTIIDSLDAETLTARLGAMLDGE